MRSGQRPLPPHFGLMAGAVPVSGGAADGQGPEEMMARMLLGVRQYQLHPYEREKMPLDILWHAGGVSVGAVPGGWKEGQPLLLLIPSMVNKAYIMDLMPERSMLRWLTAQGVNACLLDWGTPTKDEDIATIEDIVVRRLVPAIENLAQQNGGPIHVLGYCMGGTLLAGAAQKAAYDAAQNIASLLFLAAPWDFHAGAGNLLARVQFWAPNAAPMIAEKGHLPMAWLQGVFASLNPQQGAQKFADFASLDPDSDKARLFVAVEDWLNDGVDLPAAIAREPIEEWFLQNAPAAGGWRIEGRAVDPAAIKAPTLVITSRKDRLVDYDTAAALHTKITGAKIIDTGLGHIGMMAGEKAVEKCWQPVAEWVRKHN